MAKEVKEIKEVKETKKVAPTNSPLPSVQPIGDDEIGAPEIAKMLGVDAREFRSFLRAKKRNMELEKGTRYAWKRGSEEVEAIMEEYKAYKKDKPVRESKGKKEKIAKKKAKEVEEELIDTDLEADENEVEEIDLDIEL